MRDDAAGYVGALNRNSEMDKGPPPEAKSKQRYGLLAPLQKRGANSEMDDLPPYKNEE